MKYTIEKITGTRTWYHVEEENKKGEKLLIEITECERGNHNPENYPDHWLHLATYVTDAEGNCWGKYNPTWERYEYGYKIKDDMILPATEENKNRMIDMTIRLFETEAEYI